MAGRAFTPPETLSPENIHTIADVRRAVWINGFFGMGAGSVTGAMGHIVLQKLQRHFVGDSISSTSTPPPRTASQTDPKKIGIMYRCLRPLPPLGKNTFLLSLLGGGALGSFVMSTTAGKVLRGFECFMLTRRGGVIIIYAHDFYILFVFLVTLS